MKQYLDELDIHSEVKHNHSDDIYNTTGDKLKFKTIASSWLARNHELDVRHLKCWGPFGGRKVKLIIASNNAHKITEIEALLASISIDLPVVSLQEIGDVPEIVEDGTTFEENAVKKVETIAKVAPNDYILADDSGMSVDALNGEPGFIQHVMLAITMIKQILIKFCKVS